MNKTRYACRSALHAMIAGIVIVTALNSAFAQQRSRVAVRVTDMDFAEPSSPRFSDTRGGKTVGKNLDWLEIKAEYEARIRDERWIDDLELTWYVLLLNGETPRLLMQKTVPYLDIDTEEDEHYAVVYVRPRMIKRYYNERGDVNERDVVVHLEIKAGGSMVAEYNHANPRVNVPERWWTFSEPRVQPLSNALLNRLETPFANLDYDYFEYIKPESR